MQPLFLARVRESPQSSSNAALVPRTCEGISSKKLCQTSPSPFACKTFFHALVRGLVSLVSTLINEIWLTCRLLLL